MAFIKCKMCGGDIELSPDKTFGTCEYCGSTMTLPKVDDEQRAAAFNRGNHFRRIGEFDKALAVYERIVAEDDTDAEAHWCCALCRFGIEYVEDPATYEYLPTCHRASFDSFLEDVDYLAALEHSDGITKRQYQKDGAKIAEVQRGILATSQKEEPFDVFICYKETDDATKERTRDSLDAQEIYYSLTQEGYRVFFSRITLEDKAGTEYEPYIFAALNSAKVMVAIGEKPEYFNAVWVKNEWSRFLSLMRKDRSKLLLPCYKNMDPYDLPEQLSVLQSYDMAKIGFMQDLIRGVKKVLAKDEPKEAAQPVVQQVIQQSAGGANLTAQLKRGSQALEDRDWAAADGFFDKALDMDAECAKAFFGKALAAERCRDGEALVWKRLNDEPDESEAQMLIACERDEARVNETVAANVLPGYLEAAELRKLLQYDDRSYPSLTTAWEARLAEEPGWWERDRNLNRAFRYAKGDFANTLRALKEKTEDGLQKKLEESKAADKQAAIDTAKRYHAQMDSLVEQAKGKRMSAENKREKEYQELCERQEKADSETAYSYTASAFEAEKLKGYKDCDQRAQQCRERAEQIRAEIARAERAKAKKNKTAAVIAAVIVVVLIAAAMVTVKVIIPSSKYKAAEALLAAGDYDGASEAFALLANYKDSADMVNEAKYQKAKSLLAAGAFDDAVVAFSDLGEYRDSIDMVSECNYQKAESFAAAGDLDRAASQFAMVSGYRDAADRREEVLRQLADGLMANEEYDRAYAVYRQLGDNETIQKSQHERGMALLTAQQYDEAYSLLRSAGDREIVNQSLLERALVLLDESEFDKAYSLLRQSGNDELINENKYERAEELYYAEEYGKAYGIFSELNYRDSSERAADALFQSQKKGLTNVRVGGIVRFGIYEQDNNETNGMEELQWKVLDISGNSILLISWKSIDYQAFDSARRSNTTWENCSLRSFLNNEFLNTAFWCEEQLQMIADTKVKAEKNEKWPDVDCGNSTVDKVFLLSISEALKYFTDDDARKAKPTSVVKNITGEDETQWWLRTSGGPDFIAFIGYNGGISYSGSNPGAIHSVRPVIWIKTS